MKYLWRIVLQEFQKQAFLNKLVKLAKPKWVKDEPELDRVTTLLILGQTLKKELVALSKFRRIYLSAECENSNIE